MYRPSVYLVLLLALSVACPRAASSASPAPQSAYPRAEDNLAFGFDHLRWGMTSEEVRLAYPELRFSAVSGDTESWGPGALSLESYRHGTCTFRVALSFFHARLYGVGLHSIQADDALRACRQQTRRELTARYGPSSAPEWPGPVTTTRYVIPFAVPFDPAPRPSRPPPPLDLYVTDGSDISGYKAYLAAEDQKCHSITVEISTDANADSNPVVIPGLKDLGCDYYPAVSFRLQEQGTVLVDADILSDGTVENATIASSDSRVRLNQSALDILQHRVVISPAVKDSKPIAVRGRIAVTFKLTHFIRGVQ